MAIESNCPIPPGLELTRIRLELNGIDFEFESLTLQFWVDFQLRHQSDPITTIGINNRVGDVTALWSLVGTKVIGSVWPEPPQCFEVQLSGGFQLIIPSTEPPLGCILGTVGAHDSREIYEEF